MALAKPRERSEKTMSMRKRIEVWLYGLVSGAIGGGATAASAWFGMLGAKAVGMDVPSLNFKALGVIFVSGMLPTVFAYLKQSPLPPLSDGQTEFVSKTEATVTTTANAPSEAPKVTIEVPKP